MYSDFGKNGEKGEENMKKNRYAKKIGFLIIILFCVICGSKKVNAATAADVVNVAKAEVGTQGRPNKYTRWLGVISGSYSYAWCHAFVSWCGEQAGAGSIIPHTASCSVGVQWFKNQGRFHLRSSGYKPVAGDIIYFGSGGGSHVGIVTSSSATNVYTIEGNARDTVKINGGYANGYSLSSTYIYGYGSPAYDSQPVTPWPSCSNLYTSQSIYGLHEKVEFHIATANTDRMTIGIDKVGVGRVFTESFDATDCYGIWASTLGEGEYTAYFTLHNSRGWVDTGSVRFYVWKPWYKDLGVSKAKYALHDKVQINIKVAQTWWMLVGIDKEGEGRVVTAECNPADDGYSIDAKNLGEGNYSAYFTLYDTEGSRDTEKVKFSIVKPGYSTITTEKENYSLADTVRINVDSSYTAYMDVGIDKEGEGRVLTRRCDSTDGYSVDAKELGDGNYTAYFTLYSGDYNTDTEKISFSIKRPEYSSIKVSKPIYGLSELVKFSVDSKYADRMIIGINNSEGQRVLTEDCNSVNSYNVKAERLGIGDYTAYVTLYGTKSRWDYFIDTEKVSFSVREKAHEHEIVTIPEVPATCDKEGKTVGKQCATCGEIIEEPKIIEKLNHKYDDGKVTQKPTCTKKGVKTYTCEHCKKTKTEDIPATGHQKRDVRNKKEVTCEIDGYSGDEYCSDCGELLKKGTIITAIGHDWNKGEITKKATCTEAGEKTYTCKSCSNKRVEIVPETGHLETEVRHKKEATCEQNGYTGDTCCTICGTVLEKGEVISALGHNWNQGEITKEATETEEGIKTYTCRTCKKTETEVIPVKKHNWDKGVIIKQPTCTEDGERIYTCTDAGCNKTYTEKVSAKGHQQTEIRHKKEATCEEDGYTGNEYCTKCKKLLKKGEIIFALDHDWNDGEIVKEASCTESGEKVYTCARCKKTKVDIIPAKGHADTEKKREKEATCEENGYTGDECCKECEAVLKKGQIIPAFGHNWDKGTVSKEPSVTEEGIREYKCLNVGCQETKTEKIAKLPKPEEPSTEPENPSIEPTKPSTDETKPSKDNKIPATEAPKKNTETTQKPLKVGTKITDKKSKAVYKVTGKKTVQYIKSSVKNIKTVNIPATITVKKVKYQVTSIAAKAVKGNKKLTKVVIPASIKNIGAQAFAGCKNLKNITIKTPYLTKKKVGAKAFKGISAKAVIKVPKKQLKAYQKMLVSKGVSKKAKIKK